MKRVVISIGLMILPTLLLANGVPPAITYQGTLKNNGVPVNETHKLTFQLTDGSGNPYSNPITKPNYPIHQGLFAVDLDFEQSGGGPIAWQSITPYIQVWIDDTKLGNPEPLNSSAYSLMSGSVVDGAISKVKLDPSTQSQLIPVGTVLAFAGKNAPSGWLLCDGHSYTASAYPDLANSIGGNWGGDGVTTFNVPDLRGRALIGAGQGTGLTNRQLSQLLGEETHTLVNDEVPVLIDPGHSHSLPLVNVAVNGGNVPSVLGASNYQFNTSKQTTGISYGGGAAHNNMQPSAVVNYIIKT